MSQITATASDRIVRLSGRLYNRLLGLYPPQFRRQYGPHMAQVFRDCCRAVARRGQVLGFAWLWLTTLVDLGLTAVGEWFAGRPGPGHYVYRIGVGLAAGMAGGVVAGLGARLAMRGVALVAGLPPAFTLEGTLGIIVFGLFIGAPFGVLFVALRRFLPGEGLGKGLVYGLFLVVVFMVPPLLFYRQGELLLAPPLTGLALFAPLGPLYGGAVALAAARLERGATPRKNPAPAAALPQKTAGGQVAAVLLFAALLQLAVLGVTSINHHAPLLPPGVVRAMQQYHIPFAPVRDAHGASVNLIALGYFGLSGLLFWQRTASRLPRLAASLLLLFGGALFNTGARYYAALWIDQRLLQAVFHGLQVAGCTALVALLYLFPNGRLAAGWLRWLGLGWAAWAGLWWFSRQLPGDLAAFVLVGFLAAGLLAQRRRYRAASLEEQAQLLWPLRSFGVAVAGLAIVAVLLVALPDLKLPRVPGLAPATTFAPYMLPWLCLPVSIGYAVWRRRLWALPPESDRGRVSPNG